MAAPSVRPMRQFGLQILLIVVYDLMQFSRIKDVESLVIQTRFITRLGAVQDSRKHEINTLEFLLPVGRFRKRP